MKRRTHDPADETTSEAPAVRSLADLRAELVTAQTRLTELKQASPRSAEAVHAQKLVIQDLTEAIRQREAADETE